MSSQTLSPPELNTLKIEIDGEIGTLTLDRPDAFNAMSPEMIGELTVAFAWLADRAPLRALIVTGAGKAFCAGGDVTWFRKGVEDEEIDLPSEVRRGAEALHQAIVDLRRIPYPVIAAINGPAAGAGFSLALACDIRIASERRLLRLRLRPHRRLARRRHDLLPAARRRPRAGAGAAARGPQPDAAEQALEEGLVSEVVAAGGADRPRPAAKAEKLAAKAPHYVRMAKLLCGGQHREQPHRAPAAGAPRDRRQHGDRGPAQRRRRLLRRREARVPRPLNPAPRSPVSELQSARQPVLRGKDRHEEGSQSHLPCVLASLRPRRLRRLDDDSTRTRRRNQRERGRKRRRTAAAEAEGGTAGSAAARRLRSRPEAPRLHAATAPRQSRQSDASTSPTRQPSPTTSRSKTPAAKTIGETELITEGSDSAERRPETRRPTPSSARSRATAKPAWKAR